MARPSRDKWHHLDLKCCIFALFVLAVLSVLAPGPATEGQQRKSQPKPRPSPTPGSLLQRIGTPPAPPVLEKKTEQEVGPSEVISVDTTEVMLPVTVRDANGRLVSDLKREDFHVYENDRAQQLSDLALRQVPVDVILMVDASSSVAANLDDFRRAAEQFAAQLDTKDRISLIKFDDRVQLLQEWTQSRFQLHRALNRIEPGMFTRLNDALVLAARQQFGSTQSRRAIILLSDGVDSGRGATSSDQALAAVLDAQVSVYVVSNAEISRAEKKAQLNALLTSDSVSFNQIRIDDLRESLRALDESEVKLAQLAEATGGRIYKPVSFSKLDDAYQEVADELRRQYAIYYRPSDKARDGSFRRVHVDTTNPRYRTATRIGYYAPRN
jgi:VWFA-related protein